MDDNTHLFRLNFPLERTHCGIPLANGNMGVLVWGENNRLCLTVNRGDYWDHRQGECVQPGQTYRDLVESFDPNDVEPTNQRFVRVSRPLNLPDLWWTSTRLPVGRFELELNVNIAALELDYDTGIVTVLAGTQKLRLSQARRQQQLLIEDKDRIIRSFTPRPSWEWVGNMLSRVGFPPPQIWKQANRQGWFQPCPADPGINVICQHTEYGAAIALELDDKPQLEFVPEDFVATVQDNTKFWQNYWSIVPTISLPEAFWNQFFRFALYKFASATDPAGGVAAGLQGPWLEEYQRSQWSCDYHFNVNIQQIYTLGFSIGAFEHLLPLFNMLESTSFQKVMRANAKNLFGIDDGLLLTHAVDDRGYQCGGITVGSVLDFACGGWTAQLYWQYYRYTQDKKFLRERALPFMRGIMRIYEEALEEHDGRLSLPLSISAEYGFIFKVKKDGKLCNQNSGRDPSNQLMCAHMLAEALIESSRILELPAKPIWHDIRKRLPEYTLIGAPGEEHIALWEGQDLDVCHRHHSHLACIYPFETLSQPTPEQQQILDNTIDHWIIHGMGQWSEWCYPWAAIIQTRSGFQDAPILLLNLWKEIFLNEGLASVYLPRFRGLSAHRRADMHKPRATNEIMQLDGTMAGATALLESLVHQRGDTVYLFSGIPEKWQDVTFTNICLPGGFSISAQRNGQTTVTSKFGGQLKINRQNQVTSYDFQPGETKIICG